MAHWRQIFQTLAADAEQHFDDLKKRLFERLHCDDPIQIVPYIGYGTPQRLILKGRVLEDNGITSAEENDTIWANLLNMYRRFESDEIAGARVRASFGGARQDVLTDDEGYFDLEFDLPQPLTDDKLWREVRLELVNLPDGCPVESPVRATERILTPSPHAQFGVISDVDDTVLQTDVLNMLKMARNVFLRNAHTRLPFAGVAAFYHALHQDGRNPIFYLSKSPWNLFDLLIDFFEVRQIPLGPLFLTDMGISRTQFIVPRSREYKLRNLEIVLDTYPDLPFILIGDSGEKDPEIYAEVAQHYPGRILVIYIRDVTGPGRDSQVRAIQDLPSGTEMLLVEDTWAAAQHAAAAGYIHESALPDIRKDSQADKQDPLPLETLLEPDAEV
jgi:phosphatidate phosphatase APP1